MGLTNPSSVSSDENAVRDNFMAGKICLCGQLAVPVC